MALNGYTFPYQKTPPSCDGMVRAAALTDGFLTGCALSHTGFSVSMAPGHILACGRTLHNDATANWSVSGAASGFARVVMTVDMSKTSTLTSFTLGSFAVEYASSLNGFAALRQDDINAGGTIYQVEICAVSLSSAGVASIARQLGSSVVRAPQAFRLVDEIPDLTGVADGTLFLIPVAVLE